MRTWPFKDPPNVVVITTLKILDGSEWIAYVYHDADDRGWQFHTSEAGPPSVSDAAVVALSEIVQLDEAVTELADLPVGWHAWRTSHRSPWQRAKTPVMR